MWLEIILCLLIAPIVEVLITFIAEKINVKKKWSPYDKACNEAIENVSEDNFVLMLNKDMKGR